MSNVFLRGEPLDGSLFQRRLPKRVMLDIGDAQRDAAPRHSRWRTTRSGGAFGDNRWILDGATNDEPLLSRLVGVGVCPLVIGAAQQDSVARTVRVRPSDAARAAVVPVGAWKAAASAQSSLAAHDDGPLGRRQALGFHVLTTVGMAAAPA
jgi:hypothetical protein